MAKPDADLIRPSLGRYVIAAAMLVAPMVIVGLACGLFMQIRFADSSTGWFAVSGFGAFIVLAVTFSAVLLRTMLTFEITKNGISRRALGVIFLDRKWGEIVAISRFGFLWLFPRGRASAIGATTLAISSGAFIPAPEVLDDATLARFYARVTQYATEAHPLAEKLRATGRVPTGPK